MSSSLVVIGIRVSMPATSPVVLLREEDAPERHLAIWIGATEAAAIARALNGEPTERPRTDELLGILIETLGAHLRQVRLARFDDGVFYAAIELSTEDGQVVSVDARASDAIAMALWNDAPIFAERQVMEAAGISAEAALGEGSNIQDEVREFAKFLEDIDPEDFD